MKEEKRNKFIENINCHIISIIILMNALQIIVAWDFGFIFNMWIEYPIILILLLINKVRIVNIKNIVAIGISGIILAFNLLFNESKTLNFYINEFLLFALPLLLIFLIKIDLKKFTKIFFFYNIINTILYLLVVVINPEKLVEGYMTFGFYAIFSATYVFIYSYYYKNIKMMIFGIVSIPIICINGNRGTILIFATALIVMLMMNAKNLKKKIAIILIFIILGMNINQIGRSILDFITQDLGISSYSVNNLYKMLESDDMETTIGGRYNIYQNALEEFKQHLISGIGVASFQEKYGYFPHNIFLDVYSTFGLVLGTLYFIYIIILSVKLYRLSVWNTQVRILFIFMLSNIMKLMLSKTFIYDSTIWLYISLGNLILVVCKNEENKNNILSKENKKEKDENV